MTPQLPLLIECLALAVGPVESVVADRLRRPDVALVAAEQPAEVRLTEFLKRATPDELSAWSVICYLHQVSQDDDLALWRSGSDASGAALPG